jgi:hypothetical protein
MTTQHRPPFFQRRLFLGLMAVLGLAGSVLGIYTGIKPFFESKPPPPSLRNTEIILDRSKRMEQRFADGTTKLELARKAVDLILRHEILGDNLAFRALGGPCPGDGSHPPPTLAFSQDSAARVREKVEGLRAEGEATLVAAIGDAISDFVRDPSFAGRDKRIIVITGGLDACRRDIVEVVQQLNKLTKDIQGKPKDSIVLDLNYIGIGLDSTARATLDNYAEQTGGAAHFADDPQKLENVIEVIEVARVTRAATAVSSLVESSAELLSSAINKLRDKDYAAAERGLDEAGEQFARTELPYHDLLKRQASETLSAQLTAQYRRIYQAADKTRELQSRIISLAKIMLSRTKASNEGIPKDLSDEYEKIPCGT